MAASVAILAGIASADAACCQELGKRSRSENHHDAEVLLEQITPGGKRAASQLRQRHAFAAARDSRWCPGG